MPICLLFINPIPTSLSHVIYCHGDNSYPCLVGIGLSELEYVLIIGNDSLLPTCSLFSRSLNSSLTVPSYVEQAEIGVQGGFCPPPSI